jgi:hypothetical protein
MKDKRITAEDILAEVDVDVKALAQKVADAINNAQAGAIINQSEEPVRDAHALFRQATYRKALSLLEKKQQAFSPSPQIPRDKMEQQR